MSFGNLPTNIYELLGEEGEAPTPAKPASKSAPSGQSQSQNRSQKPNQENRQGQRNQGGYRPAEGGDQQDVDRKKAPRGGKNPLETRKPKGVDQPRLERRSGTGRGKENKKGGYGRGNWGTNENEEEGQQQQQEQPQQPQQPQQEPEKSAVHENWGEPVAEAPVVETEEQRQKREADEKRREEERQKEEKQMTLDEYLQKKKPVGLSLPPPRAPGEGASDVDKKNWASVPVQKDAVVVPVPEKKAENVSSEDKTVIIDSVKKLSVFEELGINVRVRDDAYSRRKAQKFEEERRKQTGDKVSKPATEDPKLKQQKKKRGPYKPPQKTDENFPALAQTKA